MTDSQKLSPKDLYESLIKSGVSYFCGVPDSELSSTGFYFEDHAKDNHDIATNEGSAIGLAIGYHLATSKIPLVYMQNSGLGNALNPLTSLVDSNIYGIPMLLLISWRGQPGTRDEAQHKKQGAITKKLLDILEIPYVVLSRDNREAQLQIEKAVNKARKLSKPYAILVKKGTIARHEPIKTTSRAHTLTRHEVVAEMVDSLDDSDAVISTTGKISRELYEYREKNQQTHSADFLVVGGMGHASVIASAIAKQKPNTITYCIDGDGALLMHMGSLATIANNKLKNFYHIVINNKAHESVGGQPTVAGNIDIPKVALSCGYSNTYSVSDRNSLKKVLKDIKKQTGPILVEVLTKVGSKSSPSRPSETPKHRKQAFKRFISEN